MSSSLSRLFPPGISVEWADPRKSLPSISDADVAHAQRFAGSRREHFLHGRACARRALAALGFETAEIGTAPDGAPRWPAQVVGAITHCETLVGAAVATRELFLGVGVDAEQRDRASRRGIRRLVCTEAERAALARLPADGGWDLVIFSAKESVYKALPAEARAQIGFKDVRIEIAVDQQTYRSVPTIGGMLWDSWLSSVEGRFLIGDGVVVTTAIIRSG